MKLRAKKVEKLLRTEKADALLVWNHEGSGQPATRWLSGFTGTWSVLLMVHEKQILRPSKTRGTSFRKGGMKTFLIADGRYTEQSKKETRGCKIFITSGQVSALHILGRLIQKQKIQKIVFDGSVTPYSVVADLKQYYKTNTTPPQSSPQLRGGGKETLQLISRKRVLQELRMVKEKGEQKLLAKAAKIACRSFTKLIPLIHVGMTEKEIAKRLEDIMIREGAEGFAFPTCVVSGKNGAFPHGKPGDKKIKMGELITIDFGVMYKRYVSDMTRTVAVGKVSPRLLKMYESVRIAQELGCRKAKAGMTGQELDAVCREYLTKKGYGNYFTHSTGHGIGMEVHELPIVAPKHTPLNPPSKEGGGKRGRAGDKERLPTGSVITCEPGVYIPNVGGVRIEDALVLTRKGSVNLSEEVTRKLIVL